MMNDQYESDQEFWKRQYMQATGEEASYAQLIGRAQAIFETWLENDRSGDEFIRVAARVWLKDVLDTEVLPVPHADELTRIREKAKDDSRKALGWEQAYDRKFGWDQS